MGLLQSASVREGSRIVKGGGRSSRGRERVSKKASESDSTSASQLLGGIGS